MPYFLIAIGAAIKFLTGYMIARIIAVLGLTMLTYSGMNLFMEYAETEIMANYANLGAAADVMSLFGVPEAFSILFSAIAIRLFITGWVGGIKSAFFLGS